MRYSNSVELVQQAGTKYKKKDELGFWVAMLLYHSV